MVQKLANPILHPFVNIATCNILPPVGEDASLDELWNDVSHLVHKGIEQETRVCLVVSCWILRY
jgi:hypothetical protein